MHKTERFTSKGNPLNTPLSQGHRRVYLIRHGQTQLNKDGRIQGRGIDAPLNDTGFEQSLQLQGVISGINFDVLISSSLKRANQTLDALNLDHSLERIRSSDLDEINFGIFEGRRFADIELELADLQQKWANGQTHLGAENGESPQDVLKRAKPKISQILREREGRHFLFILHGRLMRIVLADWLFGDLSKMQDIPHSNTGIWILDVDDALRVQKIVTENFTDHLTKNNE